jgi:potassium efflux system protein
MYEAPIGYWTRRMINLAAVAWWIYIVLDVLAIRTETFQAIAALLNTRIGIRAFGIALGDILAFATVLAAGFPAAKAIRFLLREEFFSRLRLSRGLPEMLSTLIYYVALVLVFLLSISAAGVHLDKLTVLTGAVGVGVGFGLQTFVNNFVSGLVLQFERPIRVGDVLEVGGVGGEVSRIGVRSSTVRTFQGAEVIIPNSELVSNQVVNWTLTEPLRRVELQVPVAYGTDPERVIGILTALALRHPEVLRNPEPAAYFQAFGASSLDFVLMFWAQQQNHFRLRSEIGVAVNAAMRDADIEIPFPQQDIRIRSAEPAMLPAPIHQILDPEARPRHHAEVG